MGINRKKIWLFLMFLILTVSGIYLWQMNQKERKVYADGRIVEKVTPKSIKLKVS